MTDGLLPSQSFQYVMRLYSRRKMVCAEDKLYKFYASWTRAVVYFEITELEQATEDVGTCRGTGVIGYEAMKDMSH